MSSQPTTPAEAGPTLGEPSALRFPPDWTLSTSWRRAQEQADQGGFINDAERIVWLEDSDQPHRVTFAIESGELVADCDCQGWTYQNWCAHVASCWWRWSQHELVVSDLDTGRQYLDPPPWLTVERGDEQ